MTLDGMVYLYDHVISEVYLFL